MKFLRNSVYKDVKISCTGQLTLSTCWHVSCRWIWEEAKPMLLVKTSVFQDESDTRNDCIRLPKSYVIHRFSFSARKLNSLSGFE